jgi:hypothetical protein
MTTPAWRDGVRVPAKSDRGAILGAIPRSAQENRSHSAVVPALIETQTAPAALGTARRRVG